MSNETKTVHETLNPCSVELGRSAAGKVTIGVKSYAGSTDEAYETAKKSFDNAVSDFPVQ